MQEAELLLILFLATFSQQISENASEVGATSTQEREGGKKVKTHNGIHKLQY